MRKKLFTLFLALAVSAGTLFAESGTCGDNLTWDLTDGVLTISGTGEMTYSGIEAPWSNLKSSITSVVINHGVTSIKSSAFLTYTALTSVTIPNSVTSIGGAAFRGCSGLVSVVIPNGVTSIESFTFSMCSNLTSLTIPNSVTSIGVAAFEGCSSLTSLVLPNSVTSIGGAAFSNCYSLISLTIPNSVTSIGDGAFWVVPNIIYSGDATGAPWGARSVNGYVEGYFIFADITKTALLACSTATEGEITIPKTVSNIGLLAFESCSRLTSIEIPHSVTSIGDGAFENCTSLASITIPNSITNIKRYTFYNCTSLTSITCEAATPPTCGEYVFEEVDKSIPLYVPAQSVAAYQAADGWKDFSNIIGIDDEDVNIRYIDPSENELGAEAVTLHLPDAPEIDGFTFLKWQVVAGNLEDGITLQAVYETSNPTEAPAVYTNPANPAQKLIRNGNVYLLYGEKKYTMTGQEVR